MLFPTTGKPDMQSLSNALKDVSNWHQLGIQLGIPTSELRKIEEEYQRADRRKTEALDTWLHQTPSASWSDVVSALQQMGENTVAESVCQKYIRGVPSELMHIYIHLHKLSLYCMQSISYTPRREYCQMCSVRSKRWGWEGGVQTAWPFLHVWA